MALSFSPESTQPPSSRRRPARCLNASSSLSRSAAMAGTFFAPASIPSSTKESRVPEVGGGP
jgi:hypothetical protein